MEKEMDKSSLNNMVRFEYLSNLVKLQYLRDCFKGPINTVAASILIGYFQNEIIKAKILHSDYGRAFLAYLNNPVYLGGRAQSKNQVIFRFFIHRTPHFHSVCK